MIVTALTFLKFDVATAFGFGFGWHAIVDEVAKWAGAFKDKDAKNE